MRNATLLALLVMGCDGVESFDSDTDAISGTTEDEGTGGTTTTRSTTTDNPGDDPCGMVAVHNAVRSGVQPAAYPPLPMMVWDAGLAAVAQQWANRCDFNHSTNEFGENLYVSTSSSEGTRAVESWASEVDDYQYAQNRCREVCGHYTQIVWRDSTRVGCAFADCDPLTGAGFNAGRYWVCNYDPPGNWVGEWPY